MPTIRISGHDEALVEKLKKASEDRPVTTEVMRRGLRALEAQQAERGYRVELLRQRVERRGMKARKLEWDDARGSAKAEVGEETFVDQGPPWLYLESFAESASRVLVPVEPGSPFAERCLERPVEPAG